MKFLKLRIAKLKCRLSGHRWIHELDGSKLRRYCLRCDRLEVVPRVSLRFFLDTSKFDAALKRFQEILKRAREDEAERRRSEGWKDQ